MADDGIPIHVLRSQGVPVDSLHAPQPPFQLLVYNLPPPPPGFLYGFTCSPVSVMLPPVRIAPMLDSSSPRPPDPPTSGNQSRADRSFLQHHLVDVSSTEIVPASSSDVNSLSVASDIVLASSQPLLLEEARRASNLDKWITADSSSCTDQPKEFSSENHEPQSATYTDEKNLALDDQENNSSTSLMSCAQANSDEAVQDNDRFNKAPLFRAEKVVGTSSQNGCTLATARTVEEFSAEISGYRSPSVFVDKQELRDHIVERWRVFGPIPQK